MKKLVSLTVLFAVFSVFSATWAGAYSETTISFGSSAADGTFYANVVVENAPYLSIVRVFDNRRLAVEESVSQKRQIFLPCVRPETPVIIDLEYGSGVDAGEHEIKVDVLRGKKVVATKTEIIKVVIPTKLSVLTLSLPTTLLFQGTSTISKFAIVAENGDAQLGKLVLNLHGDVVPLNLIAYSAETNMSISPFANPVGDRVELDLTGLDVMGTKTIIVKATFQATIAPGQTFEADIESISFFNGIEWELPTSGFPIKGSVLVR
jgi:hypothetical protein